MAKRTFEATLPDGIIATRTTEREYTHCAIAWDEGYTYRAMVKRPGHIFHTGLDGAAWDDGQPAEYEDKTIPARWVVLGFSSTRPLAEKASRIYPGNGWTQRQVIECREQVKTPKTPESTSGYAPAPERVPDIGTQPCSNCGYSVALHGTPGSPLCADCAVAAKHRLDSDEHKSDSSPKPASSGALKGATTMAITDRNLAPGTKLVGKHKGQTYNAEVVEVDGATRYRMTLGGETKDYKSPSAAGSAIFGVDKAGKPRTCNGWGFFSIDGDAPPAAPKADTAPTGRTRRRKKGETDNQTTEEPKPPALPIIERLDDQVECGECGLIFAERGDAVAHLAEDHGINVESVEPTTEPTVEPTTEPETEKELATA